MSGPTHTRPGIRERTYVIQINLSDYGKEELDALLMMGIDSCSYRTDDLRQEFQGVRRALIEAEPFVRGEVEGCHVLELLDELTEENDV